MKSLVIKQVGNYHLEPDYVEVPKITSDSCSPIAGLNTLEVLFEELLNTLPFTKC